MVFPGQSGRKGTTLGYAQQFLLEKLVVKDALLLDNEGDVRLWYRGGYIVSPSEKRDEIRSVFVLARRKDEWLGDAVTIW